MACYEPLPVGYRFHPTDLEVIGYLKSLILMPDDEQNFMKINAINYDFIRSADLYSVKPWDLFSDVHGNGFFKAEEDFYFLTNLSKKTENGSRLERVVKIPSSASSGNGDDDGENIGTWKLQTGAVNIVDNVTGEIVGVSKTATFMPKKKISNEETRGSCSRRSKKRKMSASAQEEEEMEGISYIMTEYTLYSNTEVQLQSLCRIRRNINKQTMQTLMKNKRMRRSNATSIYTQEAENNMSHQQQLPQQQQLQPQPQQLLQQQLQPQPQQLLQLHQEQQQQEEFPLAGAMGNTEVFENNMSEHQQLLQQPWQQQQEDFPLAGAMGNTEVFENNMSEHQQLLQQPWQQQQEDFPLAGGMVYYNSEVSENSMSEHQQLLQQPWQQQQEDFPLAGGMVYYNSELSENSMSEHQQLLQQPWQQQQEDFPLAGGMVYYNSELSENNVSEHQQLFQQPQQQQEDFPLAGAMICNNIEEFLHEETAAAWPEGATLEQQQQEDDLAAEDLRLWIEISNTGKLDHLNWEELELPQQAKEKEPTSASPELTTATEWDSSDMKDLLGFFDT